MLQSKCPANAGWILLLFLACGAIHTAHPASAAPPGWRVYPANLRIVGGDRVTSIAFPPEKASETETPASAQAPAQSASTPPIPIAGFQPFITLLANNDVTNGIYGTDTVPKYSAPNAATYYAANPATDYAIGLLDTGAPLHIIKESEAIRMGLGPLQGSEPAPLAAPLYNSLPFGLFMDGLGAIDTTDNSLDFSNMKGQSNVSVPIGDCPAQGGVPTVVGTPMTMFYSVDIHNDDWRFIRRDGKRYFGPTLSFTEPQPENPSFPCGMMAHRIPMTWSPAGVDFAMYLLFIDPLNPWIPTLVGGLEEGRLFVSTRFNHGPNQLNAVSMVFDTAAQIGFVTQVIAGDLGLPLINPDFIVDVQGVCDVTNQVPGFFLDQVSFSTCAGPRLEFSRVPILVRDFGGIANGLIGMNIFDDRNLRLSGGTFNPDIFLSKSPYLEVSDPLGFDPCDLTRDGVVDLDDVSIFREVFQGPGTDTLFLPADFDEDFDSDLDDWTVLSAKLGLIACDAIPAAIEVVADGPVDLLVTDPLGNRVSATFAEVFGGASVEFDIDGDTTIEDVVQIVSPEAGDHLITVTPEAGAIASDLYSLQVSVNGNLTILATDVRIDQIPPSPYLFTANVSCYVPAISTGGWIVLATLLAATGTFVLRRPRRDRYYI